MECLGRTDALYHNLEHTMLVTLVGRDILRGRTLTERIEATDYDHLIVACLAPFRNNWRKALYPAHAAAGDVVSGLPSLTLFSSSLWRTTRPWAK